MDGNYTAQRVSIVPTNIQQRFEEFPRKVSTSEQIKLKTPPSSRTCSQGDSCLCITRTITRKTASSTNLSSSFIIR